MKQHSPRPAGPAGSPSLRDLEASLRAVLEPRPRAVRGGAGERAAAVLVPVFERAGSPWIVLTRRAEGVRYHKGEISFPGGVHDETDADLAVTALREADEELGLAPARVRLVGALDAISTYVTGFRISPFVGMIERPAAWRPNVGEIAEVIELPLSEVAPVAVQEVWARGDLLVPMDLFEVRGYTIWGATARILRQFLDAAAPLLGLAVGEAAPQRPGPPERRR